MVEASHPRPVGKCAPVAARVGPVNATGLLLSLALYAAAFVVPYAPHELGAKVFLYGLLYCWVVPMTTAWWANPIYWYALVLYCRGRWARGTGFGACAALLACFHVPFMGPEAFRAPAFYLWLGAMVALTGFAAALAVFSNDRKSAFYH